MNSGKLKALSDRLYYLRSMQVTLIGPCQCEDQDRKYLVAVNVRFPIGGESSRRDPEAIAAHLTKALGQFHAPEIEKIEAQIRQIVSEAA